MYDSVDASHSANNNPRATFAGCLVRFAGHDFMDFRYDKPEPGARGWWG